MRKMLLALGLLVTLFGCEYTVVDQNLPLAPTTPAPPPTLAFPPTAAASPAPSVTPTYTPGEFAGFYRNGFEMADFRPCGAPEGTVYWLGAGNVPDFWKRYAALGGQGTEVFLRFTGELSPPSEIGYGHMGGYRREINILELHEMSADGKCP